MMMIQHDDEGLTSPFKYFNGTVSNQRIQSQLLGHLEDAF